MSMVALVIVLGCVALLFLGLILALAVAAKSADEQSHATDLFSLLASLRSPSGKPFFGSSRSIDEFADVLESTRRERAGKAGPGAR